MFEMPPNNPLLFIHNWIAILQNNLGKGASATFHSLKTFQVKKTLPVTIQ